MALSSVGSKAEDSLCVVYTRLNHLQQGVFDGKPNAVFSDFIRCHSLPEECDVLLMQGARVYQQPSLIIMLFDLNLSKLS